MSDALLVTCKLASPLALGADGAPHLDSLLECALAIHHPKEEVRGYKITRAGPCPEPGLIDIPLARARLGSWLVGCCSSPILPVTDRVETVEHVAKRIGVEHAGILAPDERRVVSTTNAWTKSYRLPLRVLRIACVRWLALGNRREILRTLSRNVHAVGKKVSDGYGRVAGWEVDRIDRDQSWFAEHPSGNLVLMRPLPLLIDGREWLPGNLTGFRRGYGAVSPPYWHPERYCERVEPC